MAGPTIPADFNPGSLYIAGFTQARAPHVGLILPVDAQSGDLVHIRIERNISPNWMYQHRVQKIEGDMFLSSLLKIHDVSAGTITVEDLQKAASAVPAPENDTFGECSRWVYMVIQELDRLKLVALKDVAALEEEFNPLEKVAEHVVEHGIRVFVQLWSPRDEEMFALT